MKLPEIPFFDKQQLSIDNHLMQLNLAQRIAMSGGVLVLGFVAGWWMRTEGLNDDYQVYAPMDSPKSVPRYAL
jgi:hypothetical protein